MKDRIVIRGARENNLKNVDLTIPETKWWCLPGFPVRENPAWLLTPFTQRASGGMWRA